MKIKTEILLNQTEFPLKLESELFSGYVCLNRLLITYFKISKEDHKVK